MGTADDSQAVLPSVTANTSALNSRHALSQILTDRTNQERIELSQTITSVPGIRTTNYAYQVLAQTGEGELLMKAYDFENSKENLKRSIDPKKRTYFSIHKVSRLIVYNEIYRTRCYTITPERFEELAKSIVEIFPAYLQEALYTSRTTKSNARGALASCYECVREMALAVGEIKSTSSRKRKSQGVAYSEDLEKLKTLVAVIDPDYVKTWSKTAIDEKISYFRDNTIECIFHTFPNLANPLGYLLVNADFTAFFAKPENLFQQKWPVIAPSIIKLAQSRKKDEVIKSLLRNNEACLNDNNIQLLALYLLPFLFKKIIKQTIWNKSGQNWYPDKEDVLRTFILHIKDTENFNEALEREKHRLEQMHVDHKLEFHPFYVVINGDSLSSISSYYVVIENNIYQVHSAPCAIDICFQWIKVMHKDFPIICNHVWQFIEKQIYSFPTSTGLFRGVSELIQALQLLS